MLTIVREKAKFIVELIDSKKKLKEERKKYSSWKNRIEAVGSSGAVSSDNWGSSSYGATSSEQWPSSYKDRDDDDDDDDNKKKKRKKDESESSSEDDKKKKKGKKKKKKDEDEK